MVWRLGVLTRSRATLAAAVSIWHVGGGSGEEFSRTGLRN